MGRNILGIIVGAIFAMAVIMVMQIAGTVFFPLPEAIDPSDTKALSQYIMEEASVASLLFVAFGYGVGAFAGGAGCRWYCQNTQILHGPRCRYSSVHHGRCQSHQYQPPGLVLVCFFGCLPVFCAVSRKFL